MATFDNVIPPPNSTGKKVRAVVVDTDKLIPVGVQGDPDDANALTKVTNAAPAANAYGGVVRIPEPGSAALAQPAQNAASVTILAANVNRRGFVIDVSPQKRIPRARRNAAVRTLRAQAHVEDAAVAEQLALLRQMRRATLAALAEAAGFQVFQLNLVLSAIDRALARGRAMAQQLAGGRTEAAFGLGRDLVDGALIGLGRTVGLVDLSDQLLSAVLEVTNDQLRGVWSELGSTLKATVRRAALGIETPNDAVSSIAKAIRNLKTFTSAAVRAETILRTELNRTFSIATQKRMEQSDKRLGGGLKKYWLTAGDERVRDEHVEAGDRYRIGGDPGPILVAKPFLVDGEALMFPRDPRGSAGNTINCRCVSVPYVEDLEAGRGAVAA